MTTRAPRAPGRAMRGLATITLLVLACIVSAPAHAQVAVPQLSLILPGSRVRVQVARDAGDAGRTGSRAVQHTGALLRIDADSIVIRTHDDTLAVSRGDVRAMELHVGTRARGDVMAARGAMGLGAGVLFGVVYGLATYAPCPDPNLPCSPRSEEAAHSAVTFALPGLAIGLAMGFMGELDRWRPFTLEHGLRVGVFRDGRRLGLALAF